MSECYRSVPSSETPIPEEVDDKDRLVGNESCETLPEAGSAL